VEAGFLLIVMTGPDPGIPTTTGIRRDRRIKSGDDEARNGSPDYIFPRVPLILMRMRRGPVCPDDNDDGVAPSAIPVSLPPIIAHQRSAIRRFWFEISDSRGEAWSRCDSRFSAIGY
jgi:hypothetical protein